MRKKKETKHLDLVKCECGYQNQPENVARYGTCTRCRKVLDKKAKFDYEMYNKLKLWRKVSNKSKIRRYGDDLK